MFLFGVNADEVSTDYTKRIVVTILVAATTSTATFFAGRWWGRYKANRQWYSKDFLDRVIVSLNIFADGFLKIRTVMERSVQEVFLNRVAVEKVEADYVGFNIPDYFVVGYGLDYAERYRNLPFVGVLRPEMYKN